MEIVKKKICKKMNKIAGSPVYEFKISRITDRTDTGKSVSGPSLLLTYMHLFCFLLDPKPTHTVCFRIQNHQKELLLNVQYHTKKTVITVNELLCSSTVVS